MSVIFQPGLFTQERFEWSFERACIGLNCTVNPSPVRTLLSRSTGRTEKKGQRSAWDQSILRLLTGSQASGSLNASKNHRGSVKQCFELNFFYGQGFSRLILISVPNQPPNRAQLQWEDMGVEPDDGFLQQEVLHFPKQWRRQRTLQSPRGSLLSKPTQNSLPLWRHLHQSRVMENVVGWMKIVPINQFRTYHISENYKRICHKFYYLHKSRYCLQWYLLVENANFSRMPIENGENSREIRPLT